MEEAQFTKFGHQSRVEIMTPQGKKYLTIPLQDRSFKALNEVLVHNPAKTIKIIKNTLQTVYGKYQPYKEMRERLWELFEYISTHEAISLSTLNTYLLYWLWEVLEMKTLIMQSTALLLVRPEHPSEWVAELGKKVGATIYLGGSTAQQAYIREEDFKERNITLQPQNYKMPNYKSINNQIVGEGKQDGWVSIIDPLFIGGKDLVRELIEVPAY